MTCVDVQDRVEAIAAGDLEVDRAVRDHLETCPRCASALASARRIEAALAARPAPPAPARFTAMVLARIRRERWRSEQQVDRLFNVAIAVALVLVFGGVAALVNFSAVLGFGAAAWELGRTSTTGIMERAVPAVPTYAAAAGLLLSALAMWWWADRGVSL